MICKLIATIFQCQKPAKNPMQKLPKNLPKISQKSGRQKSSKNPAKIFYENINTKTSKIYKNFVILISKQTQKTLNMNINLNTMPHEAYMLLWHSDQKFVGTENYIGLAYYWNYDYRHYLRDASPYVKRKIHNEFIKNNLDLVGSSEKHLSIIRKYTKTL